MANAGSWSVECGGCGMTYDQVATSSNSSAPIMCGACSSNRIRVVQHIEVSDNRNGGIDCRCADIPEDLRPCEPCNIRVWQAAQADAR